METFRNVAAAMVSFQVAPLRIQLAALPVNLATLVELLHVSQLSFAWGELRKTALQGLRSYREMPSTVTSVRRGVGVEADSTATSGWASGRVERVPCHEALREGVSNALEPALSGFCSLTNRHSISKRPLHTAPSTTSPSSSTVLSWPSSAPTKSITVIRNSPRTSLPLHTLAVKVDLSYMAMRPHESWSQVWLDPAFIATSVEELHGPKVTLTLGELRKRPYTWCRSATLRSFTRRYPRTAGGACSIWACLCSSCAGVIYGARVTASRTLAQEEAPLNRCRLSSTSPLALGAVLTMSLTRTSKVPTTWRFSMTDRRKGCLGFVTIKIQSASTHSTCAPLSVLGVAFTHVSCLTSSSTTSLWKNFSTEGSKSRMLTRAMRSRKGMLMGPRLMSQDWNFESSSGSAPLACVRPCAAKRPILSTFSLTTAWPRCTPSQWTAARTIVFPKSSFSPCRSARDRLSTPTVVWSETTSMSRLDWRVMPKRRERSNHAALFPVKNFVLVIARYSSQRIFKKGELALMECTAVRPLRLTDSRCTLATTLMVLLVRRGSPLSGAVGASSSESESIWVSGSAS
mmetsp:Transcript_19867/g.44365  ORF Transcript_19867/g.44365 Transcript_19867/m.44365 type:complete len:573 (-) Transcript_19867:613-2331(-)